MASSSILGKYQFKNTFMYKIDARIKMFLVILLMVASFLSYGTYVSTFIVNGSLLLIALLLAVVSKISFKQILVSLKFLWITMVFILLINVFIPHSGFTYTLFDINGYNIYLESIFQSLKILLRIFTLILFTLILTSTTKSTDIAFALEWYMTPLKWINIPVGDIAMVMSLALRFIPLILEETNRIKQAQTSRGIDFERGNIFKRIKAFISLLIPLLFSAISRSLEMADAMEVKGFQPSTRRTRYEVHKFSRVDFVSLLTVVLMCCGYFTLAYFSFDILKELFGVANAITQLTGL